VKRNCDIVMKGGITSGVVYPKAIARLSDEFRLRNVGGTSAGAIGAAAAAAAQYGDNHGQGTGFRGLKELPGRLGTELEPLFQPSAATAPLFSVVLGATKAERGLKAKSAAIAQAAWGAFGIWGTLGLLPGAAFIAAAALGGAKWWAIVSGVAGGVAIALIGAIVAIVSAAAARFVRTVPENYFGLCTGYSSDERGEPKPLTTWLAAEIETLAGTEGRAKPLTFGDLWGTTDPKAERLINLQMLSTCLTHGAAYSLPIEASGRWWFSPKEFRDLFPKGIVDWMEEAAPEPEPGREGPFDGLRRLPVAADMPVVVAARMSLSFPVLISAVPLYTIDRGRKERVEEARRARVAREAGEPLTVDPKRQWEPERCWFSDGGITSNFPIQFFDSPVPRWPTFGIDLREFGRCWQRDPNDESKNVEMPMGNKDGRAEPWTSWEELSDSKKLSKFLASISATSRAWMDNAQMRAPGYRDRIVHIAHDEEEGGMNLAMPEDVIKRMSTRGERAADELVRRFAVPPRTEVSLTWDNQRWLRYRAYMTELEDALIRLRLGCVEPEPGDKSILELSDRGPTEPPNDGRWKPGEKPGQIPQGEFADSVTNRLIELAQDWQDGPSLAPGSPRPRSQLRLTPRL
jgi:predicted acylesterase/phospholipase RssA